MPNRLYRFDLMFTKTILLINLIHLGAYDLDLIILSLLFQPVNPRFHLCVLGNLSIIFLGGPTIPMLYEEGKVSKVNVDDQKVGENPIHIIKFYI